MERSDKTKHERLRERDKTDKTIKTAERQAIVNRRSKMFSRGDNIRSTDAAARDEDNERFGRSAAGLALSGGGIRSASLNLGLLQAFVERGLIRWIDYLSTVSGGGFVGTYLSTLLCHNQIDKVSKNLRLIPQKKQGESTPASEEQFLLGGRYLKDGLMILDRFCIGFLLNVTLWGSLLVFITATIALIWRFLDSPWLLGVVRDHGGPLAHYFRDWSRPFLFSAVLFILWIISWIATYFANYGPHFAATRPFAKRLLLLMLLTVIIGIAVLLSTNSINWAGFPGAAGKPLLETQFKGHEIVGTLLMAALVLNILPYLNPVKIFRSEMRPPGKVEGAVLRFSGAALLLLMPFAFVYLFSSEGISNFHAERDPDFVAMDIPRPFHWLARLRAQAERNNSSENFLDTRYTNLSGGVTPTVTSRWLSSTIYTQFQESLTTNKMPSDTEMILHGHDPIWSVVKNHTIQESLLQSEDPQVSSLASGYLIADSCLLGDIVGPQERIRVMVKGDKKTADAIIDAVGAGLAGETKLLGNLQEAYCDLSVGQVAVGEDKHLKETLSSFQLETIANFGLIVEELRERGEIKYTSSNFVRKVASAHMARVLNDNFLAKPEPIERLIETAQVEDSIGVEDETIAMGVEIFFQRAQSLREGNEFVGRKWPEAVLTHGVLGEADTRQLNRWMIETLYASDVEERTKAGPQLCWRDDQFTRLYWALGALVVFLVLGTTIDVNATSLHGYFRKKLEDAFVIRETTGELLRKLDTTEKGGPYHFLCGTVNFFDDWPWRTTEYQSAYTFYFSPLECGSQALPGPPASTEQYCQGKLDVASVAAISGAAFSPAILRSPLLFCMTMLLNLRLGQWLPNPAKSAKMDRKVTMVKILKNFLPTLWATRENKRPENWDYLFISDGGHNDNLAISPLLFRQNRLVIISDATQDENFEFPDFMKALRRYRSRANMHFRQLESWDDLSRDNDRCINLDPLRPEHISESENHLHRTGDARSDQGLQDRKSARVNTQKPPQSKRHFVLSKFTYPDDGYWSVIVYIKSTMTGDEEADLEQYQVCNPKFPHDPTTDQFFTENQVESYRQLGNHIGLSICETIQAGKQKLLGPNQHELEYMWDESCDANDACQYLVEDMVWLLLLGYFDGALPNDTENLLELLQRSRNEDLSLEIVVSLAKHYDERHVEKTAKFVARHFSDDATSEFQPKLRQYTNDATLDALRGDASAIRFFQFVESLLITIKRDVAGIADAESVGESPVEEQASEMLESLLIHAIESFDVTVSRPTETTLKFLLDILKTVKDFDACLDLFKKLVVCRFPVTLIDDLISTICGRFNSMYEEDKGRLESAILDLRALGQEMHRPIDDSVEITDVEEHRLIDYLMVRLAEDRQFPQGLNDGVRELLRDDLFAEESSTGTVDFQAQVTNNFRNIIARHFEESETRQEDAILMALGMTYKELNDSLHAGVKVAFAWRPRNDDEKMRYLWYRPNSQPDNRKKIVTKKSRRTMAGQSLNEGDGRAFVQVDIENSQFTEPFAAKGTVAVMPCHKDAAGSPILGVLYASCGRVLRSEEVDVLKKILTKHWCLSYGSLSSPIESVLLNARNSQIGEQSEVEATQDPSSKSSRERSQITTNDIWADEGAVPRHVTIGRFDFDFEDAIDVDKVEAVIADIYES